MHTSVNKILSDINYIYPSQFCANWHDGHQIIINNTEGSLFLMDCSSVLLPNNLFVGGILSLTCSNIDHLPKGLTVGSYLNIQDTKISYLPDDLVIGNSIYLRGSKVTESSVPAHLLELCRWW